MSNVKQGVVKWFSSQKGYGFITDEGGVDYFAHYSQIKAEGFKNLKQGEAVNFVAVPGKDGKMKAENILVK